MPDLQKFRICSLNCFLTKRRPDHVLLTGKLAVTLRSPLARSHPTRFACAALATWLFFSCGVERLNAQKPSARQHAARAAQLVQAGDLKGAESEMRQAVELSPKEAEYLIRLGLILSMQERPKVTAIFFERALKLDPTNQAVRRHLAGSQWQSGRLEASLENLEFILKSNPRDSEALLMLGMVLMDAGRFPWPNGILQTVDGLSPQRYHKVVEPSG
jgi:Flp pilus assembly protein TadD